MDLDKARDFLRVNHRGIVATMRPDGRPQMSVVAIGLDAEGRAVISSREPTYKVRMIRRDPRVSVCVTSGDYWRWIQIDGTATLLPLPEAMEPLVEYYRGINGEHPDWDDYRRAMVEEERVLIRIDIERAGPDEF
jgi:PPOX class probable F420-dependent enzyme